VMRVLAPAPRDEWRAVLAGDASALPEHAPEWVTALCDTGRYADASRYYVLDDGRQFVLPLVRRTGLRGLGGALASYPPAWGIGGLVGAGLDPSAVSQVLKDLRGLRMQRISIRPDPTRWQQWANVVTDSVVAVPRRCHVIDLTDGPDAAWHALSKSARRGVRTAERAGVRVEVDRSGQLLEDYYRLYLLSVDRWAARQHEPRTLARLRARRRDPLSKLQALSRHLGKSLVITVAYIDAKPASGSVTVLGQTAHDIRAAMDADLVGKTYAGDLVQWTTIALACDQGCSAFHLGESGRSVSLAQFKEKFGAQSVDYAELRLERLPYTRADSAIRSIAKRLLGFRDA
jgi:Acetyltransferase (GNAT) domain